MKEEVINKHRWKRWCNSSVLSPYSLYIPNRWTQYIIKWTAGIWGTEGKHLLLCVHYWTWCRLRGHPSNVLSPNKHKPYFSERLDLVFAHGTRLGLSSSEQMLWQDNASVPRAKKKKTTRLLWCLVTLVFLLVLLLVECVFPCGAEYVRRLQKMRHVIAIEPFYFEKI